MTISVFQKKTLLAVAKELEVNPVYVARYFGFNKGLPRNLSFTNEEVLAIKQGMGLTIWWKDHDFFIKDDNPSRRLVRELAYRILKTDLSKKPERADNLVRGLQNAHFTLVRSAINEFIKRSILKSGSLNHGISIRLVDSKKALLQQIVDGKSIPSSIERLWT
jgi:hypothetical protein